MSQEGRGQAGGRRAADATEPGERAAASHRSSARATPPLALHRLRPLATATPEAFIKPGRKPRPRPLSRPLSRPHPPSSARCLRLLTPGPREAQPPDPLATLPGQV